MITKCSARITVSRDRVSLVVTEPLPGTPGGTYRRTVRAKLTESLRTIIGQGIASGDNQAALDAVLDAARRAAT